MRNGIKNVKILENILRIPKRTLKINYILSVKYSEP